MNSIADLLISLSGGGRLATALVMGGVAALLTTLGSLGVFLAREPEKMEHSALLMDVGMAFSSGVMLVASFTSLLLPAIDMGGINVAIGGFLLGALAIYLANRMLPHEHLVKGYEGPEWGLRKLKAAWLVAFALLIHNLPEGMAIGATSIYSPVEGVAVGLAIGIQDIPEGLAVTLPVAATPGRRWLGFAVGALSGLTELVMAGIAAALGSWSLSLLPWMLGFGAGAMVYVVSSEALPESHRSGHESKATLGFLLGFLLMLYLDTVLG